MHSAPFPTSSSPILALKGEFWSRSRWITDCLRTVQIANQKTFSPPWARIRWCERSIQLFERSGWHSGDKNGWFGVVLSLVTELVKSWSSKIRLAPADLKNRQSKLTGSQRKISTTQRTHKCRPVQISGVVGSISPHVQSRLWNSRRNLLLFG